ncbi:hypothetical protein CCP3SC1AL1_520027 [Gammaproteobacteria bacterium]
MAYKLPRITRKFRKGQTVSYNVVDENSAYNVTGEIVKIHKEGTFDVDTGFKIDRRVEPEMVEFGTRYPIGVIKIKRK